MRSVNFQGKEISPLIEESLFRHPGSQGGNTNEIITMRNKLIFDTATPVNASDFYSCFSTLCDVLIEDCVDYELQLFTVTTTALAFSKGMS